MFQQIVFVVVGLGLLSVSDALLGIGSTQTIHVQGSLTCDGRPAGNTLVKLYDDNSKFFGLRFLKYYMVL